MRCKKSVFLGFGSHTIRNAEIPQWDIWIWFTGSRLGCPLVLLWEDLVADACTIAFREGKAATQKITSFIN